MYMTTELTKSQIDDFFNDGYIVLKDFFTNEQLGSIEKAFVRLYAMQAAKILKYRNKLSHGDRLRRSHLQHFQIVADEMLLRILQRQFLVVHKNNF